MSPEQEQERREDCRREVLRYLVERSVLAFRAETIRVKLDREHGYTREEIAAALTYHVGENRATKTPDRDGSTPYFQATPEGIRHHERA